MDHQCILAKVSNLPSSAGHARAASNSKPCTGWRTLEVLSFLLFGTVGMAAIGLAVLSPAVAGYFSDKAVIQASQDRIESLQELQRQQAELLANMDHPAVIERSAISNLHYRSSQEANSELVPLPAVWDELENALERIEKPDGEPEIRYYQRLAETLCERPPYRIILLIVGSALVIVSLSCFNRSY